MVFKAANACGQNCKPMSLFTCSICHSSDDHPSFLAREMMQGLKDKFLYFQCSKCHCLQIAEVPDNLSKYYQEGYYSFSEHKKGQFSGLNGWINKRATQHAIFKDSLLNALVSVFSPQRKYRVFNNMGVIRTTRILDVGCGDGRKFLYPLSEIGFESLLGCDPFLNEDIQYESGLKIEKSDVFSMRGQWDVITFHHSFEHVTDPEATLAHAASLLSPTGICIIRVPTVSSYAWEKYGVDWVQLDAPRHIFIHSKTSMSLLATNVGLELFQTKFDSTHFQFVGSEKYVRGIPLRKKEKRSFFTYLQYKLKKFTYIRQAKQLNEEGKGDQAAFYFRKSQK